MRFADIPASVGNAEEWMCTIGDDGTATLGYFTVYALLQNEMPFKVVLVDRKVIERKTWDFQISEHTGKRGFKIDLIRVVNVLYMLGFFTGKNGAKVTKKEVFTAIGKALNIDLSTYDSDLSRSLSDSTALEKHLSIFDRMRQKMVEVFNNYGGK